VSVLDEHSPILWQTVSEPPETWGKSRYLGSGLGASGVVSTTWLGIPCARKEFHGGDGFSFFTEAHILAMLKHPRIVSFFCYGSGLERTDRFIALELMEMSLYDLIQKQKHKDEHFSLPVAVDMMAQIACGMCYLHGQGVAHRDLKPHNIVVSSPFPHLLDYFDVKLIDFGISKRKVKSSDAYTMSYRGIGTSQYRAPELHPRAQPDGKKSKVLWFKADAFSFAMTCMHILTLRAPFIDLSPSELYFAQCMDGRRPEFPIDCPMELVALIRDCWNIDPCVRPSFIEICIRLEAFYHRILSWSSIPDKDGTNDEDIRFKLEELCNIQRSPNSNTYDKVEVIYLAKVLLVFLRNFI
jgi:serine/threonine protein kinase